MYLRPSGISGKSKKGRFLPSWYVTQSSCCCYFGLILNQNQIIFPMRFWSTQYFFGRAQWARSVKNPDVSTGPLARPFTHSLAPLSCSLAPPRSLRSRVPLRSLVCSFARLLACSLRSLCSFPRSWESNWLDGYFVCVFFLFWAIVQWQRDEKITMKAAKQKKNHFSFFFHPPTTTFDWPVINHIQTTNIFFSSFFHDTTRKPERVREIETGWSAGGGCVGGATAYGTMALLGGPRPIWARRHLGLNEIQLNPAIPDPIITEIRQ